MVVGVTKKMSAANTVWAIAVTLAAATLISAAQTDQRGASQSPAVAAGKELTGQPRDGANSQTPDSITLIDSSFPPTTVKGGKVSGTVFMSAPNCASRQTSLTIALRTALGTVVTPTEIALTEKTATSSSAICGVPFIFSLPALAADQFPVSGWLAVTDLTPGAASSAENHLTNTKPIEIKAIFGENTGADWSLLGYSLMAAVLAVSLVVVVAVAREGGVRVLGHRMGSPTWSFADSWSSTLTIGGALLTSVVSFAGLPDQGHTLSKKTYGIMSLALAGLIALAPGVYGVFRKAVQTKNELGVSVVQYQGFVILFLLAAVFTVTGVLAQLGLLRLLFHDVAIAGLLSPKTADFFGNLFWVLQVLLLLYAAFSAVQTIHTQSTPKGNVDGTPPQRPFRNGVLLDAESAKAVQKSLPDWALL
jgi:hypothetical protein